MKAVIVTVIRALTRNHFITASTSFSILATRVSLLPRGALRRCRAHVASRRNIEMCHVFLLFGKENFPRWENRQSEPIRDAGVPA